MTATITRSEVERLGYRVGDDGRAVRNVEAEPETWQAVERECRALFERAGCTVYSSSQRRRAKVSVGVPDLLIFSPPGYRWCAWWECKSGRGALTEAQRKFALHCQRTGQHHGVGGVRAARAFLRELMTEARS